MSKTVGDFILGRLGQWGVTRIYGYPGDGVNGLLGALGRAKEHMTFIQVRHEETAALMACAHAKFSDTVGVCLATSGPGAIHLLNGLYDAKMDHQPVVALVGQAARSAIGGAYQQDVDLLSLFKDVASAYVQMATTPAQVRHLIDRAVRIAVAERTVTCVILPQDLQQEPAVDTSPHEHGTVHSGVGLCRPTIVPTADDLSRAADVLNAGSRVAMLIGAGAIGSAPEVIAVADALGAGVAKALLGKAALPDALPFVTGPIGLLGSEASAYMMTHCDTLLMIGSGFPYSEFLPREGQARGIQIDIAPRQLGLRYPMEINLVGDAGPTLRALLPRLKPKTDRAWREALEGRVAQWWAMLDARAQVAADPINPQQVFRELSPRLPDQAIIAADSGTSANWFARDLQLRAGMKASVSGSLATMGCALPYALAAKFVHPDRVAFALLGDGAMQMNGVNELITVAKYWRDWSDPRLIILVLNNRDLNMVTWEQRGLAGEPKYEPSQNLPDVPYATFARSLGLEGIRVERPDEVGGAWDRALRADRPVVLDVLTDPNVPLLPPHISWEQAKQFASSVLAGDVDALGFLRQTAKEVTANVLSKVKRS
jgi:pyruvate dehydrogenase (quinone)